MMTDILYRLPEVMARTGLARSTIYHWIAHGEFPQPIKLGERISAWRSSELETWLASRIQGGK